MTAYRGVFCFMLVHIYIDSANIQENFYMGKSWPFHNPSHKDGKNT